MTKEPWYYGNGTGLIVEEWLRLRHKLIPFLYSCDYKTHKEGIALIEPLYYAYPNIREAYLRKEEYFFGGLLVAPVTQKVRGDGFARTKVWIPEGRWTDIFTGDVYVSPEGGTTKELLRGLDSIPVLAKAGTILPLSADKGNRAGNPENAEIRCWSGDGTFTLYEDGAENEQKGEFFTEFVMRNSETEGAGLQTLEISSEGDPSVLPENRRLRIRFADIPEGEVSVYADGEKMPLEESICDCAAAEFAFEAGKNYRVEVRYSVRTEMQKLIARANDVLIRAKGINDDKNVTFKALEQTKTVAEYLSAVENSNLSKVAKLRLTETLL